MSKLLNERLVEKLLANAKHIKTIKGKLLIWMCKNCKWVTVSDQQRHRMDFCKCYTETKVNKGVFVDYEVDYMRYGGCLPNMKFIAIIDADKSKLDDVWLDSKTVKHIARKKK